MDKLFSQLGNYLSLGILSEGDEENKGEFLTMEDLAEMSQAFIDLENKRAEEYRKSENERKQRFFDTCPYKLVKVVFGEKEIKKYNIDTRRNFYRICDATGKSMFGDAMFDIISAFVDEYSFLYNLCMNGRYAVTNLCVVEHYGEWFKKDKENKGKSDLHYAQCPCVIDVVDKKIVYQIDHHKYFNSYIHVYKNIMSAEYKLVYLPENSVVVEKYNELTETKDNVVVNLKSYGGKGTFDSVFVVNKENGNVILV